MAYIDRAKILIDMGKGLMCRIYLINSLFQSEEKPTALSDPELQRIRARIDKSFPDIGDLSKIPGVELFQANAPKIVEGLAEYEDVLIGAVDFARVVEPLLQEIPRELLEIRIERSQAVVMVYFDLLVVYMRVMFLLKAINDRKSIFALYSAAYSFINQGKRSPAWNDACILLPILDNLQRFFIDSFASLAPLLKPLLLQLKESIQFSTSIAAVDNLRAQFVLNPVAEGAQLIVPSNLVLSRSTTLSAYTEVMNTEKYNDYVLFTHLACPSLLFSADSLQVFDLAASNVLFISIFRDLSLSIHDEFDNLTQQFPGNNDTVAVPKGFKFKTVLRDIAKRATKECAHRMRYRRSFITAELQNIKGILLANPGLLGPKFPLILAASAFAKSEILAYYRHVDQQGAVRKDCRKYYFPDEFVNTDVTAVLYELAAVSNLVKANANIIREYYAEYLAINDVKALQPLFDECSGYIPAFLPVFDSILGCLKNVKVDAVANCADTILAVDFARNSDAIEYSEPFPNLTSVRVNWDRLIAMLASGKYGKGSEPAFESVATRMRSVVERTRFVDNLGQISQDYLEAFECWWFRANSWKSFYTAMAYSGATQYPMQSLVHFRQLQLIGLNVHDDCKHEKFLLSGIAVKTCDAMVEALVSHILKQLQNLWDCLCQLDAQVLPIEAGRRIERMQAARRKDMNAAIEPYPGFESEGGDMRKNIMRFVAVRSNLTQVLAAAQQYGAFQVGNREYDLSVLLRLRISSYLEHNMHKLFMDNPTRDELTSRPSISTLKFVAGCRAIQIALGYLGCNFQLTLRSLLFRECVDVTIPPPGTVLPTNAEASRSLVWRIALWYTNVADRIAAPSSGIVWVPPKKLFAVYNVTGGAAASSSSSSSSNHSVSASALVTFLNSEDLRQLTAVIGPQGVRVIDSQLVSYIMAKIKKLLSFIDEHRSLLTELQGAFAVNMRAALRLKAIPELEQVLTCIGVALNLREILHDGLDETIRILVPNLPSIVASVAKTLLPYSQPSICTPVYTLLSDLGAVSSPDLALASSLSPGIVDSDQLDVHGTSRMNDLKLFPVACAALFVSDKWDTSIHLLDWEAFDHNQHVMMTAVASLMVAFFASDAVSSTSSTASVTSSKVVSSSSSSSSLVPTSNLQRVHAMCELFLQISSQILLTLRSVESTTYQAKPLRSMCALLEQFINECSSEVIARSELERYLPYSLLHSGLMEVSLGRMRDGDGLKAFTSNDSHSYRDSNAHNVAVGGKDGDGAAQSAAEAAI